ncbi:MAG: PKD domain-containing protein [Bacteroidales bacterium]
MKPSDIKLKDNYGRLADSRILTVFAVLFMIMPVVSGQTADFTADSQTVCEGGVIVFTDASTGTTGSVSYAWDFGNGASPSTADGQGPYTVTYSQPGPVTVSLTIIDGAVTSTKDINITVNAIPSAPVISADGPLTFCEGGSVTLTSSASTTYLWSTGETTQSIIVTGSGDYSLTVTDANGCTSPESEITTVTVNALPSAPVISADGPLTFCEGGSVTLTSSASTSYLWSTGETTQSIMVTESGDYSLTVTDASGCTSPESEITTVTVNPTPATPVISADGPLTFCEGGSVTLTSSASATYLWSTGETSQSIMVTESGDYSLTVTDASGCTSPESEITTVTVNPLPEPAASSSSPVCEGDQLQLTGAPDDMDSYSWSGPDGFSSPLQSPVVSTASTLANAGEYTLTVANSNGCQAAASTTVEITQQPAAEAGSGGDECDLDFVLGATASVGTGTWAMTSGSGTASFSPDANTPDATVTVSEYGTKEFTWTEVNGACSDAAGITVNFYEQPVVDAGSDAGIPNGASTTLDGTVTGDGPFTYSWEPASLLVDASAEDPTTVNLSATTTFTLTATSDVTGCSASDEVTITITGSALSASASATPSTVCAGESVQLLVTASGGSGTYTYTWTSGPEGFSSSDPDPVATPTETTTYYVEVNDGYNTVNAQVMVTFNTLPAVSITGPEYIAAGFTTNLSPVTGGTWISNDPSIASVTNIGVVTGVSAGTATFTYTDNITGCSNTTTTITVRSLPEGWEINPAVYTYNGQVTAKVYIEESAAESGVLAAFAGDECRGIIDASYFEPSDHYVFELMCYDINSPGARLTFRYYDPVEDVVYMMDRTVDFSLDMVIGNALNPMIMAVGVDFNKSFPVGWSWFSVNILMDDMTLGNVLSPDLVENDYIKNQVASSTYYEGYGWFGELEEIDPTELYKIKIQNISDIDITGWAVDVATTPMELVTGWNWIGYLAQESIPIGEALSSVSLVDNDYIKNQKASSTYYEGYGWFGDQLSSLVPGDGYMMKIANPGTLVYPSSSGTKSIHTEAEKDDNGFNPREFEFNGSVSAKVLIDSVSAGSADDQLIAYVDDEIRGTVKGQYFEPSGEYLFPIMIHSNSAEGEIIKFRYYDALNDRVYDCEETITFKKDIIVANAYKSFDLNIKSSDANILPDSEVDIVLKVYPNPFEHTLNIEYSVPERSHISLTVFDIYGKPINILVDQKQQPGNYSIQWDAHNQYSGIYIIRYMAGNVQEIRKVHLIR